MAAGAFQVRHSTNRDDCLPPGIAAQASSWPLDVRGPLDALRLEVDYFCHANSLATPPKSFQTRRSAFFTPRRSL
jgi:hypothetical protein